VVDHVKLEKQFEEKSVAPTEVQMISRAQSVLLLLRFLLFVLLLGCFAGVEKFSSGAHLQLFFATDQ
jgi:hypothetical protein